LAEQLAAASAADLRTSLGPPLATAVLGVRAAEWDNHEKRLATGTGSPLPLWTRF